VYRYVSVRHGGKKLTTDKEINGWSLGAVGRGTVMEYLESYCTADDGFEFFGGSVNTKYLVSAFNDDDGFDTDEGYNGQNQFWFGIQEPTAKDNGSEQNGQPQPPDVRVAGALPLATYTIRNATLIGAGTNTTGNDGLRFRCGEQGALVQLGVHRLRWRAVRIDDDGVSTPELKNNLFWGYKAGSTEDYGGPYVPADSNPVLDPMLGGISRKADGQLDPTLKAGSPAYSVPQTETPGFREGELHRRLRVRELGAGLDGSRCRGLLQGQQRQGGRGRLWPMSLRWPRPNRFRRPKTRPWRSLWWAPDPRLGNLTYSIVSGPARERSVAPLRIWRTPRVPTPTGPTRSPSRSAMVLRNRLRPRRSSDRGRGARRLRWPPPRMSPSVRTPPRRSPCWPSIPTVMRWPSPTPVVSQPTLGTLVRHGPELVAHSQAQRPG
jgi:hypothetical protein